MSAFIFTKTMSKKDSDACRNKKLLITKGIATRNKGITTSSKKLLGAPGIATRSKNATSSSWPYC